MKLISFIFIEVFLGIILGVAGAFVINKIKRKRQKKTILKDIEKQDLKKGEDKTPINFFEKPIKLEKLEKVEETKKIVAQNRSVKTKKMKKLKKEMKKVK